MGQQSETSFSERRMGPATVHARQRASDVVRSLIYKV